MNVPQRLRTTKARICVPFDQGNPTFWRNVIRYTFINASVGFLWGYVTILLGVLLFCAGITDLSGTINVFGMQVVDSPVGLVFWLIGAAIIKLFQPNVLTASASATMLNTAGRWTRLRWMMGSTVVVPDSLSADDELWSSVARYENVYSLIGKAAAGSCVVLAAVALIYGFVNAASGTIDLDKVHISGAPSALVLCGVGFALFVITRFNLKSAPAGN